jgi:hypothetical protein
MRVSAVQTGDKNILYPKLVVLSASLLMGGTGWAYLVPLIYIRNEGLEMNAGLFGIITPIFWPIVLFIACMCSFLQFFELMLGATWHGYPCHRTPACYRTLACHMTPKRYMKLACHTTLGCFIVGGFGMAIYTELIGGLWYGTILSLPASFRGGLGFIHSIGVVVSHMALRA